MSKLTPVNISILADTDCPSDWDRDDLLEFAQEAARRIQALEAALDDGISAVEHAAHPVASQWLPKLRKVRAGR